MSPASISATRRPLEAASSATPAPVIPAPMTTTSKLVDESDRTSSSRRKVVMAQCCHNTSLASFARRKTNRSRHVELVGGALLGAPRSDSVSPNATNGDYITPWEGMDYGTKINYEGPACRSDLGQCCGHRSNGGDGSRERCVECELGKSNPSHEDRRHDPGCADQSRQKRGSPQRCGAAR